MKNKAYRSFKKEIQRKPKSYYEDFLKVCAKVEVSSAKFNGKTLPFQYQPMFYSDKDIKRFETITTTLTNILKKVVEQYLKDENFRKYFGFSELMHDLIMIDPGYSMPFPIARYDLFYNFDEDYIFCEFNSDGTSGMNESNPIEEAVFSSNIITELSLKYKLSYFELFDSWIDKLLSFYEEFSGISQAKPNVAIMDWQGVSTIEEFKVFSSLLKKRGCNVVIADPRELRYDDRRLYFEDLPIDLVYRRALTFEICEHRDEVKPLLDAYQAGDVCMVGPFRSHIIHNKQIFSILRDKEKTAFLSEGEREFIRKHIPYTKKLSEPEAEKLAKANKDDYILKPTDRYGSKGVHIGRDYEDEEWSLLIECIEKKETYLVQKFIEPPQVGCVHFKKELPYWEKYNYITGLFVYDGKFAGLYTRTGKEYVIASITGCKIMPNFYAKSKKKEKEDER